MLGVSGEAFAQARYASDAAACEALCRAAKATIVLAPRQLAVCAGVAGVAHRMGGCDRYAHHMRFVREGRLKRARWFYRQRIEAVITRSKRPWFLLLDAGTHAAFSGAAK